RQAPAQPLHLGGQPLGPLLGRRALLCLLLGACCFLLGADCLLFGPRRLLLGSPRLSRRTPRFLIRPSGLSLRTGLSLPTQCLSLWRGRHYGAIRPHQPHEPLSLMP